MLDRDKINQLREQLKTGVRIVSAPQLFPTPPELAARMVSLANIHPEHSILEPSAGTGRILDALSNHPGPITAVELNVELSNALRSKYPNVDVIQDNFLEHAGNYDRILMNPPFKDGADIKHIRHAASLLNPGGCLVAICAAGPRQYRELEPMAARWEALPSGTFADEGTGINTALMVVYA